MKRYFLYSILLVFFYGCEEVIPEYSPLYGEPTTEYQIRDAEILSVADDGTVWAISEGSDDCKHIFWIKNGLIKSQPVFECSGNINGYGAVGDSFYYIQRRELIIHTPDTVMVIELPKINENDNYFDGELYTTETLVVLFSYSIESRYWILDGDRWIQRSMPVELSWRLRQSINDGYYRNNFVFGGWNESITGGVIYNLENGEQTVINPNYTDELGNTQNMGSITVEPHCFDQQGNFYFTAAYNKLFRANIATQAPEIIPVSISGVDDNHLQIIRVAVASNDDVWVTFRNTSTYDDGIFMLGSGSPHYIDNMDLGSVKLFADGNGILWAYADKIYGFNEEGLITEYEATLDIWREDFFIKEDNSGAIWFGQCETGLHRYSNGNWFSFHQYFETFWEK